MKRLDNSLEMDVLLAQDKVDRADIDRVLQVLIPFHRNAEIIRGHVTAAAILSDFADVAQIRDFCTASLGAAQGADLIASIAYVKAFLTEQAALIAQRDREGFTRDVHGDLHAGNIFLTDPPILFDCIEFSPHFRRIDLLNELAFFTMELEFAGHPELSAHLMERYNSAFPVMRNAAERTALSVLQALPRQRAHEGERDPRAADHGSRRTRQADGVVHALLRIV